MREIAQEIDLYMFKQVVSSHQFDEEGGCQFRRDMYALFAVFRNVMTAANLLLLTFGTTNWSAKDYFPKSFACAHILSLPSNAERIQHESHAFEESESLRNVLESITLDDVAQAVQTCSVDPKNYSDIMQTLGIRPSSFSESDVNYILRKRIDS